MRGNIKQLFSAVTKNKVAVAIIVLLLAGVAIGYAIYTNRTNGGLKSNDKAMFKDEVNQLESKLSKAKTSDEKNTLLVTIASTYSDSLKDPDGAISALKRAITNDPEDYNLYERLGDAYIEKKSKSLADKNYRTALEKAKAHSPQTGINVNNYETHIQRKINGIAPEQGNEKIPG